MAATKIKEKHCPPNEEGVMLGSRSWGKAACGFTLLDLPWLTSSHKGIYLFIIYLTDMNTLFACLYGG